MAKLNSDQASDVLRSILDGMSPEEQADAIYGALEYMLPSCTEILGSRIEKKKMSYEIEHEMQNDYRSMLSDYYMTLDGSAKEKYEKQISKSLRDSVDEASCIPEGSTFSNGRKYVFEWGGKYGYDLQIRDAKGNHIQFMFKSPRGKTKFNVQYSILQSLLSKPATKEDAENIISMVSWGETAKIKAASIFSDQSLVYFDGNVFRPTEKCIEMLSFIDNALFAGNSFERYMKKTHGDRGYMIMLDDVGEVFRPGASFLDDQISDFCGRNGRIPDYSPRPVRMRREKKDNDESPLEMTLCDRKETLSLNDAKNPEKRKILAVKGEMRPSGKRIGDALDELLRGNKIADEAMRELEHLGLIIVEGDAFSITETGKDVNTKLAPYRNRQ